MAQILGPHTHVEDQEAPGFSSAPSTVATWGVNKQCKISLCKICLPKHKIKLFKNTHKSNSSLLCFLLISKMLKHGKFLSISCYLEKFPKILSEKQGNKSICNKWHQKYPPSDVIIFYLSLQIILLFRNKFLIMSDGNTNFQLTKYLFLRNSISLSSK